MSEQSGGIPIVDFADLASGATPERRASAIEAIRLGFGKFGLLYLRGADISPFGPLYDRFDAFTARPLGEGVGLIGDGDEDGGTALDGLDRLVGHGDDGRGVRAAGHRGDDLGLGEHAGFERQAILKHCGHVDPHLGGAGRWVYQRGDEGDRSLKLRGRSTVACAGCRTDRDPRFRAHGDARELCFGHIGQYPQ
jgi:hypothetical protein